jgi:hypothetical protein
MDERNQCKQYDNLIPVIDTALFSMAMDRVCYNAAISKLGSILNTSLSHFLNQS